MIFESIFLQAEIDDEFKCRRCGSLVKVSALQSDVTIECCCWSTTFRVPNDTVFILGEW
jgi:hypothetical protein